MKTATTASLEDLIDQYDRAKRAGWSAPMKLTIDVTVMDLPTVSGQASDAIDAGNVPPVLFRYGGVPVRIETDDEHHVAIKPLTLDMMRYHIARWATWTRTSPRSKSRTPHACAPPDCVVRDLLASPDLALPVLQRIVHAPVFDARGHLCDAPGYSGDESRIFYAPQDTLLDHALQAMSVDEARTLIVTELLGDFPFTGAPEIAHAVALLLLPFARDVIVGPTPLHLIEKPSPGTGATLLVTALLWPALGRDLPVMSEGRDEDEWRKRLMAKLASSPVVTLIDNLRRRLDSAALSSVITSRTFEDRLLGSSTVMVAPVNCAWVATGNNPALSNELTRRTVRIRLDARHDRPWLRDGFRHPNLLAWVETHRLELVSAATTLINAWIDAGCPLGTKTMGMFESWSKVMGGILTNAGIAGFLDNLPEFYDASDDETATWTAFVMAWAAQHEQRSVGVADLFALVTDDVPLELGDKSEKSQRTKLGKMINAMRDRCFAGYRIVAEKEKVKGAQRWRLQPLSASEVR